LTVIAPRWRLESLARGYALTAHSTAHLWWSLASLLSAVLPRDVLASRAALLITPVSRSASRRSSGHPVGRKRPHRVMRGGRHPVVVISSSQVVKM